MNGWFWAALAIFAIGLALDIYIGCTARRAVDDYSGLTGIVVVTVLFGGASAILAAIGGIVKLF